MTNPEIPFYSICQICVNNVWDDYATIKNAKDLDLAKQLVDLSGPLNQYRIICSQHNSILYEPPTQDHNPTS
jgi:hypothetical protein